MTNTFYNFMALIFVCLIVQLAYSFWIIPTVQVLEIAANNSDQMLPRNFFIIVKDLEQKIFQLDEFEGKEYKRIIKVYNLSTKI